MPVTDLDATLVEQARGGDPAAFEELMLRYEDKVYRLAMGMMKNREDALDAVQDAFLSVFRKLDTFKGESAFSTWLYRIAMNSVYMRLRSRSRHDRTQPLEDLEQLLDPARIRELVPHSGWSARADDELLRKELGRELREAVASLPEEYRAIFTLREVEDLSNQEVADILGLSLAATKTRLHRARLFLRHRLAKYLQGNAA
ncbi:MAG TPA: sigma-70 family RNA polymerase sigma factor [Candidatus Polarisedimenticolia bacterium]|nr:sigma-70 family RNA polymerase sigma factor [Candidatus Polarisedimenticolia bacterium]